MGIATMILGDSGTGKSTSLRNLNPSNTLLIQALKKPLPFKAKGWSLCNKENPEGTILVTDKSSSITTAIQRTNKEIIIIDDFQYILANEFMRRVLDKESGNQSFQKYNEIAKSAWDILNSCSQAENKRIYILSHTQTDDFGKVKIKTLGKLLDEKIVLEGMVTIVLRTSIENNNYYFSTKNNNYDTVKSPIDMFQEAKIENDLLAVDKAICEYYDIQQTQPITA